MTIGLTIVVVLLGAIIAQGFFSSVVLLFQKDNRKSNLFLSVLLLLFSLWLCDAFFRVSGVYSQNPNYYFLPIYYSLAFGPLTYLYTKSLTQYQFKLSTKHVYHFIPVVIQALLYTFLQLNSYEFRRWFWLEVHEPFTYDFEFSLSFISLIVYSVFSLKRLKEYRDQLKNNYSNVDRIRLNWLRYIQIIMIAITLFWLSETILRIGLNFYQINPLSSICMGFSILFIAIGALNQKDLGDLNITNLSDPSSESNELDVKVLDKIKVKMELDSYYLQQELSLKEFAIAINITERKLSYHINAGFNMNFIDFVNEYRVNHVKKLIEEGHSEKLSLFGIALESGFNSKPTFNRVFKKHTNKSPTEFKKDIQNAN
jgi:AraC-like DNA-binding protein